MTIQGVQFQPDFTVECRICGTTPCVIVHHPDSRDNKETELCGCCFFLDSQMIDWQFWNESEAQNDSR